LPSESPSASPPATVAALPLSSAQRDTLDSAHQTITVTAALTLAITILTFLRLRHGNTGALDWALLAASVVTVVGQILAGRNLRNALIIEGAELTPMFQSLRWLGLVFALKALVVVLMVSTILLRLKGGGGLM
jgi:Na+/melibiose symporter-like transporter